MVHADRIIILVDADCFYCQVEEKLDPSLAGRPIAVVQFNAWRDGGIIAVNYAARDKGCTKGMWMNEAKQKCPDIKFASVTNVRGRADLTKYRDASKKVSDVLQSFTHDIERASIDESYIDVTDLVNKRLENGFQRLTVDNLPDTHVVGCETPDFLNSLDEYNEFTEANCRLVIGGLIAQEMRAAILQKTGYKCSAGISHNKILAKLACGFHKPNQQTILPANAVSDLFKTLPLKKIKRLGGKFGASVAESLQVSNVGDLLQYSEKEIAKKFDDKTAKWLYNITRGIDLEPVTTRIISKSISCCKRFPFKHVLTALGSVEHWLNELAIEVTDRLEQDLADNNRRAKQITVSFAQEIDKKTISCSKTFSITSYKQEKIFRDAFDIAKKNLVVKSDGSLIVNFLGLSAGNFQENTKISIIDLFKNLKSTKGVKKDDQVSSFTKEDRDDCSLVASDSNVVNEFNENIASSSKEDNDITGNVNDIDIQISYDDTSNSLDDLVEEVQGEECESQELVDATQNQPAEDNKDVTECEDKILNTKEQNAESNTFDSIPGTNETGTSNSLKDQYSKSFFLNYFSNLEKKNREDLARENSYQELNEKILRGSLEQLSREPCSSVLQNEPEESEVCLECRKKISVLEMVSHMEYHFAMKLVTEEQTRDKNKTTDQKRSRSPTSNTKKQKTSSSSKGVSKARKKSLENKSIKSFLGKVEDLNDSNSDVCGECRKRVRFEDFESHSDYHAAKRLHSELNSDLKKTNKGAVKDCVRTNKDISSFFKKT